MLLNSSAREIFWPVVVFNGRSRNACSQRFRIRNSVVSSCEHTDGGFFEATLRPSDRAIEQVIDRSTERSSDRAIERSSERAIERPSDRTNERPSDRATERPSDRAIERPSVRAAE